MLELNDQWKIKVPCRDSDVNKFSLFIRFLSVFRCRLDSCRVICGERG